MNLPNPYFQEVVDAHVDIEQWLSGRAAGGRPAPLLARLLARFSPRFTMITLQGAAIDFAGVDALFSQGHGARPGLRIEIDALQVIAEWDGGAAIGYRETQADDAGRRTVRRSTAVFERDARGRIVWRHLHETPAAE
ncbi:hypothetical protein WT77_19860 [Burkholderia stagnalis]|uniref:hypothetical protein n=1 Tax=Burkholderia stagnalis TaxID=1503054 RepID=UPI00075FCA09|nr:hypothetical protein [Burkholderia stagnalis]KWK21700.1 hypothetical protein WT77_19860 [Burkholderia stagnalis]